MFIGCFFGFILVSVDNFFILIDFIKEFYESEKFR